MQVLYRFIQALTGAITPVYNQLVAIGDKPLDIFSKLQGLLSIRLLRQVNIAAVTGGASSTADINIAQLVIPANRLVAGDVFKIQINGIYTKPLSGGTSVNFWVKIGATKMVTLAYVPTVAQTSRNFFVDMDIDVRSIGASGSLFFTGFGNVEITSTPTNQILTANGNALTVDTTAAQTITIGFNFSNSNATNNVTANTAKIFQV